MTTSGFRFCSTIALLIVTFLTFSGEKPIVAFGQQGSFRISCKIPLSSAINSSPIANSQKTTAFFGTDGGEIWAIDFLKCTSAEGEWPFLTGGAVRSSIVVSDDLLFASSELNTGTMRSRQGQIFALTSNGQLVWRFITGQLIRQLSELKEESRTTTQLPSSTIRTTPLLINDTVFVGSDDGNLYAIDRTDGELKWAFPMQPSTQIPTIFITGPIRSSPKVDPNGVIYFGSDTGSLYALSTDGTPESANWPFYSGVDQPNFDSLPSPLPSSPYSISMGAALRTSPAVDASGSVITIYIGSSDGNLYAIRSTGEEKWRFQTNDEVRSSPIVGPDRRIYFGSDDGHLYVVNFDGSLHCSFHTRSPVRSSPAVIQSGTNETSAYFGAEDGTLYELLVSNTKCHEQSSFATGGNIRTQPLVFTKDAQRYILFGSNDKNFYVLTQ